MQLKYKVLVLIETEILVPANAHQSKVVLTESFSLWTGLDFGPNSDPYSDKNNIPSEINNGQTGYNEVQRLANRWRIENTTFIVESVLSSS